MAASGARAGLGETQGMAAGGAGPAAWEVQSPWDWRQAWKASRVVYFGV